MTSPVVEATNTSAETAQVTTHTIALPAGINNAGRLIKVLISYAITANSWSGWPTNWVQLDNTEQTAGGDNGEVSAYYWTVGGGEFTGDGTDTISITSSVATRSCHHSYHQSGAENPSTQAPQIATAIFANAAADPPSISPNGGSKDYTFIAAGFSSLDGPFSAAPTNYTNLITNGTGGTNANHSQLGTSRRSATTATENPDAYANPDDATMESVAATFAIHPAGAGPPPGQPFKIRTQGIPTGAGRQDRPARWN